MSVQPEALEDFVAGVRASGESDFYRNKWGANRDFKALPAAQRADLVRVPLSRRRYKNEKALVKIVHTEMGPFLSEWGFSDIRQERYGALSSRPMVCLSDPHDALEKALWCYEQDMVPALGEKNPAVAESVAAKYRIDSLICDAPSLRALEAYLRGRDAKLRSISILGTAFSYGDLAPFSAYAERVRLVLALPETGAFAEAPLSERPAFVPHARCFVEDAGGLLLTKLALLATPIVRYKTDIAIAPIRIEKGECLEFALA